MRPTLTFQAQLASLVAPPSLFAARDHTTPEVRAIAGNGVADPHTLAEEVARTPVGSVSACWAGWVVDDDDPGRASPRTWGAAGWIGLERACRAIAQVCSVSPAEAPRRVLFWTRARTVLSDAPSCARFLRECQSWAGNSGVRFGLVVDPIAMLTREMLPTAPDHVARVTDAACEIDGVAAIVAADVGWRDPDAALPPEVVRGLSALIADRVRRVARPEVALVIAPLIS